MSPRSRPLSFSLGLSLFSVAAASAWVASSSAQPGAAASASGQAPSASAATSASAAPKGPPLLRGADIPAGTSDVPKIKEFNDEWSTIGKVVRATREAYPCTFTLVREWLRIRCEDRIGATMFAGDPADVRILASGGYIGDEKNRRVTITMRMRRGETKMFSLVNFEEDYNSRTMNEAEKISVSWRDDREDPLILVSRY